MRINEHVLMEAIDRTNELIAQLDGDCINLQYVYDLREVAKVFADAGRFLENLAWAVENTHAAQTAFFAESVLAASSWKTPPAKEEENDGKTAH